MSHVTRRMRRDAARLRGIDRKYRTATEQLALIAQRPGQALRERTRLEQRDEELIATLIDSTREGWPAA